MGKQRYSVIGFRVNDKEKELLYRWAEEAHLPVGAYVRYVLFRHNNNHDREAGEDEPSEHVPRLKSSGRTNT